MVKVKQKQKGISFVKELFLCYNEDKSTQERK